jgi:hypothetical protein
VSGAPTERPVSGVFNTWRFSSPLYSDRFCVKYLTQAVADIMEREKKYTPEIVFCP